MSRWPAWACRALVAALAFMPEGGVMSGPVLCPTRRLTGYPCPTCGLTRSLWALLHGRLRTGIAHHAFGPLALACLVAGATVDGREWEEVRARIAASRRNVAGVVVGALVWVTYAIVRATGSPGRRSLVCNHA